MDVQTQVQTNSKPESPKSLRPAAPAPPTSVQIVDRIGDVVGTICLTVLCVYGQLPGWETAVSILSLLGGLQGLRSLTRLRHPGITMTFLIGSFTALKLWGVPELSIAALLTVGGQVVQGAHDAIWW